MTNRTCAGKVTRADGRRVNCPHVVASGRTYCTLHERERERARGTANARGYDIDHQRRRALVQRAIDAGLPVRCVTCGERLLGHAWDMGHTEDRLGYVGPQCQPCNRGDGGKRGAATRTAR